LGRELDYRAIVERHSRKHTGLRQSAKACPVGVLALETGIMPVPKQIATTEIAPDPTTKARAGSKGHEFEI
jgi:hypothetical protein